MDGETCVFLVFFLGMAVYYGGRLFALTPWYDELYTYYYFISRGPVYAAIHWPLPNNHVGYSALSACLGIFGSPAVALRGVSYLCSLGSLILLYRIGRKCFAGFPAWIPVFVFAGMSLVNQMAVQGRGYALVTFCYLTALWELLHIAVERRSRKRDYVFFGLSLVMALWAVPSSLYVVMPVCLIGGTVLLLQKEYGRLGRLIVTSVVSAVCTAGLYGILWLAIGSNLLIKSGDGAFAGMSHASVILRAPLQSLGTGVRYMLDTPYIQSMTREQFQEQAAYWLYTLFGSQLASGAGLRGSGMCCVVVAALLAVTCRIVWKYLIKKRSLFMKEALQMAGGRQWPGSEQRQMPDDEQGSGKEQRQTADDEQRSGNGQRQTADAMQDRCREFLEWFFLLTFVLLTIILIIQCKLPYQRVFSFLGVPIALLTAWLAGEIGRLADKIQNYRRQAFGKQSAGKPASCFTGGCLTALAGLGCVVSLGMDSAPYSMRDELLAEAYEQVDMGQTGRIAVTDCDQEYFLLYAYDKEGDRVTRQVEEADLVLMDKALLGKEYGYRETVEEWKLYLTGEEVPVWYLEREMEPIYENWHFILYRRKTP